MGEEAEDAEVLQEQETRWEMGALSWAQLPLSWGENPLLADPYDECLGQLWGFSWRGGGVSSFVFQSGLVWLHEGIWRMSAVNSI